MTTRQQQDAPLDFYLLLTARKIKLMIWVRFSKINCAHSSNIDKKTIVVNSFDNNLMIIKIDAVKKIL